MNLKIIFGLVSCAILSVIVDGQERSPVITIGAWMENDFSAPWNHNSTPPLEPSPFPDSIVVPSSVRGLSLVCNASYPVEWNFHRERWGGKSRLQYAIKTTRISDDLNVKGFSTELSFFSFESNSITGNYTCQKVGYSGLSDSLYVFWEGGSPPYLTLAKTYRKPVIIPFRNDSQSFTLPCIVSTPSITPILHKEVGDHEVVIPLNQSVTYEPKVGYTLTDLPDPYGKYSCSVGDVEEDGDGDIVSFTIINADDGPKPEFNDTIRHGAYFHIDSNKKEITCCSAGPKGPKLKLVQCDHPTICALAKHTLHKMESSKKRNGSCSTIGMRFRRAGVFRCAGAGIDIVREYFYPMPEMPQHPFMQEKPTKKPGSKDEKDSTDASVTSTTSATPTKDAPDPYFDWKEADQTKMMLVTKIKGPLYVGENRTFLCRVSPFYYAEGIVWGVGFKNESMQYYNGLDGKVPDLFGGHGHPAINNRHFQILLGHNQAYLDITIEKQLDSLVCFAPVWNSSEWGSKAISFEVKMPTSPTIHGKDLKQVTWYLNDTMKSLVCDFDGEPTPKIIWKRGNRTLARNTNTKNNTSTLSFPRVSLFADSDFECIATNEAGSVSKNFHVTVIHSSSSALSVILILSLVAFIIISLALAFMCKRMKSQKNVISHLANLAFKDVNDTSRNGTAGLNTTSHTRSNVSIDTNGVALPTSSLPVSIPPTNMYQENNKGINGFLSSNHPDGNLDEPRSPTSLNFSTYQKF
ncbi:unnamed protein product [Orchesella dallaii]|uniref:Ig-like domain-containing protein n=1 Tax=Orchesella dallaii TaxID=48710 RepID=A0ABP1Q6R9_9HEXA